MSTLHRRVLFITGASRGIGKAIALRAAQDGASIVVASKTAKPHPKLPGTIYSAAKDIEAAGGKALPLVVDVRDEKQVREAVRNTIDTFGGIDVLINNASAIQLTGTLDTSMKRYDLVHQVNTRGTYLCSQLCLPYLLKANNPHVLNISPPLNMHSKWFKNHTAYTMAKYGMSMCVLGMAAEFASQGVAFNALWPKTTIATAAIKNIVGGDDMMRRSRKPSIMADAAHAIVTSDSHESTGQFFVDEDVLRDTGVNDFDDYAVDKGSDLFPDYFLD
jgi:citronellol/citronellal dehydrogenase